MNVHLRAKPSLTAALAAFLRFLFAQITPQFLSFLPSSGTASQRKQRTHHLPFMPGVILVEVYKPDDKQWLQAIAQQLPSFHIESWTVDTPNEQICRYRHQVEFVVAWKIPASILTTLPNLRAVLMMSAGVDTIQPIDAIPKRIPIVRLVDNVVFEDMAVYVVSWVTHFHLQMDVYVKQQANKFWHAPPLYTPRVEFTVGVLGFGNVGQAICKAVCNLGYRVCAWCRSVRHNVPDVCVYTGKHQLDQFLRQVDVLVNALPLTDQTRNLINSECLAKLKGGVVFINVGRGATVDTEALCVALDSGVLRAAVLDTHETEPLPPESALWSHPSIVVTPHISGRSLAKSGSKIVANNIKRICAGEDPFPVVNRDRGY